MKHCKRCNTEKPKADFPKDRSKPDGLNAYCKACARAHAKKQLMRPPRRTPPPGLKWCANCKQDLPTGDFHKSTQTYDGLHPRCKPCAATLHERWRLKNKPYVNKKAAEHRAANRGRYADYARRHAYGLEPGQYDAMLATQDGRCAICGTDKPGGPHPDTFAVDHCHDTGKVRGLLCMSCNTGLGRFKHNPEFLQGAIKYLRESSTI